MWGEWITGKAVIIVLYGTFSLVSQNDLDIVYTRFSWFTHGIMFSLASFKYVRDQTVLTLTVDVHFVCVEYHLNVF